MGESACWLHLICHACGSVSDRLDPDGYCPACRAVTTVDADARSAERPDGPDAAPAPAGITDLDTTNTTDTMDGPRAQLRRPTGAGLDAAAWDQRYAERPLVWSAGPNQFLVEEVAHLPPGRALDLACGEGRNALWLAEQGWQVTGTDFSPVAIDKARQRTEQAGLDVTFEVADATAPAPDGPYDLVIVFYLQLPAAQRRAALRNAAAALAPDGTLLVVGHDRDNLERGVGGPSSPEVLLTVDGVLADLAGTGLEVYRAEQVTRDVAREDGTVATAIDCIVRAVHTRAGRGDP